jgi:hypothetical protein
VVTPLLWIEHGAVTTSAEVINIGVGGRRTVPFAANLEADKFLNGSGVDEPTGLLFALDDEGSSICRHRDREYAGVGQH